LSRRGSTITTSFPTITLAKHKAVTVKRTRDCVLNRTLIDRTTNQIISNRAPSDYLSEIRNTDGFPLDPVLESHCLPIGASSPLTTNDFDAFLDWRQDRIWQEIKRVTGLVQAADLEAV